MNISKNNNKIQLFTGISWSLVRWGVKDIELKVGGLSVSSSSVYKKHKYLLNNH
jgi:hypothetical protein